MKLSIDSAEKRINEIISQKNREINEIQESITKAEATADNARKQIAEATTAGDGHKYSSAKDELRTAEDIIEMQKIRLDNLQNNPMTTQEEYDELSSAIQKSMTETVVKHAGEIKKIYAQLNKILDKEEAELARCNDLLSMLQNDIMGAKRESDGVIHQDLSYSKDKTNIRKIAKIINPHDLSNPKYL